MKKSEIVIGGHYTARVSGKFTTVRVDAINDRANGPSYKTYATHYNVTNLATGRKTTFRSAARFRSEAKPNDVIRKCGKISPGGTYGCSRPAEHNGMCNGDSSDNPQFHGTEAEQRSDPTSPTAIGDADVAVPPSPLETPAATFAEGENGTDPTLNAPTAEPEIVSPESRSETPATSAAGGVIDLPLPVAYSRNSAPLIGNSPTPGAIKLPVTSPRKSRLPSSKLLSSQGWRSWSSPPVLAQGRQAS